MTNLPNICKCGQEATVVQNKRVRADGSIYVYMICSDCKRANHLKYKKKPKLIRHNDYSQKLDYRKLSDESVSSILSKQRLGYYG